MYDEVYEVWRREKESTQLQSLPGAFYGKLVGYVKRLKEEGRMLDKESVKAKLLECELENVEKIIAELVRLRLGKVLGKIKRGETVSENVLTVEERKLCKGLLSLSDSSADFLKGVLQGRLVTAGGDGRTVVRFLKDVPAFVGVDMKAYGPFRVGDVASLPAENVRVLVNRSVAALVEVAV